MNAEKVKLRGATYARESVWCMWEGSCFVLNIPFTTLPPCHFNNLHLMASRPHLATSALQSLWSLFQPAHTFHTHALTHMQTHSQCILYRALPPRPLPRALFDTPSFTQCLAHASHSTAPELSSNNLNHSKCTVIPVCVCAGQALCGAAPGHQRHRVR